MKKMKIGFVFLVMLFLMPLLSMAQNMCLYNPNTIPLVNIRDLKTTVAWQQTISISQTQYSSSINAQNFVSAGILNIVNCSVASPTPTATATPTCTCNVASTPACANQFTPTVTPTFTVTSTATATPTLTATPIPYGTVVTGLAGGTPTPAIVNNTSFTSGTLLSIVPIGTNAAAFNVGNYCYACGSGACTLSASKAQTLGWSVLKY
jgi:hypothetical protein